MAKTKSKLFYYLFWIQSSRGTDKTTVRVYKEKPKKEVIKGNVEAWCEGFGAWQTSENFVSYGWKLLPRVPKHRRHCLALFNKACKRAEFANKERNVLRDLLMLPPFNGKKMW